MSSEKYLTPEGLEKLKKDLDFLKKVRREEIRKRIEEAIKLGDLSENAEYHEAKDDQGLNEARIREGEEILKDYVLINEQVGEKFVVEVGSTIKVKFNGLEKSYTIVGPSEANPGIGLISNESPLGQAFIGHKVKDEVAVEAPAGIIRYKILAIE